MARVWRGLAGRRFLMFLVGIGVVALALPPAARPPQAGAGASLPGAVVASRREVPAGVPSPMPVISRGVPVHASADEAGAAGAADADYTTVWRPGATRAWLAYDLSGLAPARRGRVILAWYAETGVYDYAAIREAAPPVPVEYRIEAHAGPGGATAPVAGWVSLVAVRGNTLHSRQHLLDLGGYRWVRLRVVVGGRDLALNLDLHDAAAGADDGWLICGSSSNAAAMDHGARGAGTFAEIVAARLPGRFPVQENGGMSGTTSGDGARLLPGWLPHFPGRYVALTYGLNDANRAAPGQVDAEAFYRNYVAMIEATLAAGKVPVVSTVPWARTATAQANTPLLNRKVEELYAAYPQVLRGPDLYGFFVAHPDLISADDLHPSAEGFAAWRRLWAESAITIYGGIP